MTDTEGAREDMRWAKRYLDQPGDNLDNYKMALTYIRRARQKDPNITLKERTPDKQGAFDYTPTMLEAQILAFYGFALYKARLTELQTRDIDSLIKQGSKIDGPGATDLLEESVKLFPHSFACIQLAKWYVEGNQRNEAVALMQDAQRRWPDNFDVRQYSDTLAANPDLGIKPYQFPIPRPIIITGAILLFFLIILLTTQNR
jgi:hypothetical protein